PPALVPDASGGRGIQSESLETAPALIWGKGYIEANKEGVPDVKKKSRRRLHPEVAHPELPLAPDPELVLPQAGTARECHRALHAPDRHHAGDREQDVR